MRIRRRGGGLLGGFRLYRPERANHRPMVGVGGERRRVLTLCDAEFLRDLADLCFLGCANLAVGGRHREDAA